MKSARPVSFVMVILLALTGFSYAEDAALDTENGKISYGIGYDIGRKLKAQIGEVDADAFVQGLRDQFGGKESRVSDEEFKGLINKLMAQKQIENEARNQQQGKANKDAGEAFLKENAKKKGVKATESGLQYKVLKSGDGKVSPKADDTVVVHYRGTLIDGTEFDSSYKRGNPATFPLNGVIKGFSEALQMMKKGDRWEVYVPSDLAYGERQASELIGPNSTLIFELELVEIK